MKKKAAAKVKASPSKVKKTNAVKKSKPAASKSRTATPPKPVEKVDPRYTQAVQNYENGLKALQQHKFDKAKGYLEKVLEGPSQQLADRARMHINSCNQQLARTSNTFKTPEEQYDYAVALMNGGDYDSARAQIEKILKNNPKADYAIYGMAMLESLSGRVEEALRHLQHSIKLNVNHRFQARNEADFATLADDPRYTELIYPEAEPEAAPPKPKYTGFTPYSEKK